MITVSYPHIHNPLGKHFEVGHAVYLRVTYGCPNNFSTVGFPQVLRFGLVCPDALEKFKTHSRLSEVKGSVIFMFI